MGASGADYVVIESGSGVGPGLGLGVPVWSNGGFEVFGVGGGAGAD